MQRLSVKSIASAAVIPAAALLALLTVPCAVAPAAAAQPSDGSELKSLQATVIPAERGIDITLAMSLQPEKQAPQNAIWVRALCAVGGEWYDGSQRLSPADIGSGDHVVAHIQVGRAYRLGVLPTACHLAFQRESAAYSLSRDMFAIRCWNGHRIVDGRCPTSPRLVDGKPIMALRSLSVAPTPGFGGGGAPGHLDIAVEGELVRAIQDARGRITADCTLPGGAVQSSTGWLGIERFHPGKPFFVSAMLFTDPRLTARPIACTLQLSIVDAYDLAREPLAVRCWSGGAISPGACKP